MANKSLTNVPEQNHDAMRAAAMHPVSGEAGTPDLAAGGGLELPGRERNSAAATGSISDTHEPIPGERDATTITHRQPGAMSAPFNGTDNAADSLEPTMEQRTVLEHGREGGGLEGERFLKKHGGK